MKIEWIVVRFVQNHKASKDRTSYVISARDEAGRKPVTKLAELETCFVA